jgi:hypothetical protein
MRGLIAIASGIAAISILAVAVLVIAGNQPPTAFPPDSPEAALQGYLTAFEAGDYPAAYDYFSADVQAVMSLEKFENAAGEYGTSNPGSRRVTYDGTVGSGDRVTLQVTVETSASGGLSTDRYTYQTEVSMVREDGEWRIDQALVFLDPGPVPMDAPYAK